MTPLDILIASKICYTIAGLTVVTGAMSVYLNFSDPNIVSRTIILASIPTAFMVAGLILENLLP